MTVATLPSTCTSAWRQLGVAVDHCTTAEEAMNVGLLGGWDVRKWPSLATDPDTGRTIAKMRRADVVRSNPVTGEPEFLGEVGEGYHPIQNEDHADLLDAFVEESGASFDTVGCLEGGRKVFVAMRLPGHILVGGADPVETYIAAMSSHDGSMAFTLMTTPIRVATGTMLNLAFPKASNVYRVRHTSGAGAALHTTARDALALSFVYLDAFQLLANRLAQTPLEQQVFEDAVEKSFSAPRGASRAAVTRSDNKIEKIVSLFDGTTAWAGLNALTEWADHHSPTRGEDRENARAIKAILDPSIKNDALQMLLRAAR